MYFSSRKFADIKIFTNDMLFNFRIDFHPGVYEHEEKVGGTAGCKRCGYRVYDAEKLMAAGRVSIPHLFFGKEGQAPKNLYSF